MSEDNKATIMVQRLDSRLEIPVPEPLLFLPHWTLRTRWTGFQRTTKQHSSGLMSLCLVLKLEALANATIKSVWTEHLKIPDFYPDWPLDIYFYVHFKYLSKLYTQSFLAQFWTMWIYILENCLDHWLFLIARNYQMRSMFFQLVSFVGLAWPCSFSSFFFDNLSYICCTVSWLVPIIGLAPHSNKTLFCTSEVFVRQRLGFPLGSWDPGVGLPYYTLYLLTTCQK